MMNEKPKVTVIILNFNGRHYLGNLLDKAINSALNQSYKNLEVIFADNGSSDDSIEYVSNKYANKVKVIDLGKNYGFCVGNNIASRHAEKGLIDVLYIWYLVVRKIPNAKLVVAGKIRDEFSKNEIEKLIHKLGLSKNVFVQVSYESLPHEKVIELLTCCKVLVYPTKKDVWPLVVGEALSVGTPVIAYALPGIEYAYSWHPAIKLVKIGDVIKFAEEVVKILQDVNTAATNALEDEFTKKRLSWKKWRYSN